MDRIINLIEAKLKEQEDTIALQKWQIADLERKLEEAEKAIAEQAHCIDDLTRKEVIR